MRLGFLLTGHGSLNAFLRKHNLASSASCSCSALEEIAFHVLCGCPIYDDIRDLQRMELDKLLLNYA